MQGRNALLALLAGIVAFGLGTVVVTEALDSYVWPSLFVGLPVGVVFGVSAGLLAYVGMGYWTEQRDAGTVSAKARRRLRATVAAVGGGVVAGSATVLLLVSQPVGVALALLVSLGVGFGAAVLSAVVVWGVEREGRENGERASG